jgi:hypothetical protein
VHAQLHVHASHRACATARARVVTVRAHLRVRTSSQCTRNHGSRAIAERATVRRDRMSTPRAQCSSRRSASSLLFAGLLASAAWANVRTVGPISSEFTTLTAAVASAHEGDILLVASGTYTGFTVDGKALSILADAGADVRVTSLVSVRNIGAAQCVMLSGLVISGSSTSALVALDVQGTLRVQGSTLRVAPDLSYSAVHGAVLTNVARSAFSDVVIQGGLPSQSSALAGDGLHAENAHVALYGCTLRGGTGASGTFGFQAPGTNGGAGLSIVSGEVFASSTTFFGGPGGHGGVQSTGSGCAHQTPLAGGSGGAGLSAVNGSVVRVRAATSTPGGAGLAGTTPCGAHGSDGTSGAAYVGAVTSFPDAEREITSTCVAREGQNLSFHFDGEPGDRVFLFLASAPAAAWQSSAQGVVLIHNPFQRRVLLGALDGAGMLDAQLPVPELGPGVGGMLRHAQSYWVDVGGVGHLGGAVGVALIDRAY